MLLEGSCHCHAVRFSLQSKTPVPYMHCYCSICRKTAGGGGYAINLGGDAETLTVTGKRHIKVYRARLEDGSESPAERRFCNRCGSALWVWDPRWPELIHPFASASTQHCRPRPSAATSWSITRRAGSGSRPTSGTHTLRSIPTSPSRTGTGAAISSTLDGGTPTVLQGDLATDPRVPRTIVVHNTLPVPVLDGESLPCVGVYAFVVRGGTVKGGEVWVL